MDNDTPDLVSVTDAARELGYDRATITRWIGSGRAYAEKLGTGKNSPYLLTRHEVDRLKASDSKAS